MTTLRRLPQHDMLAAREAKKRKAEEEAKLEEEKKKLEQLKAAPQTPPPLNNAMQLESGDFGLDDFSDSDTPEPPPPKKKRKTKQPKELIPVPFRDEKQVRFSPQPDLIPNPTPAPLPDPPVAPPTSIVPTAWNTFTTGLADAVPKLGLALALYFIQYAIRTTPPTSQTPPPPMVEQPSQRNVDFNEPRSHVSVGDFITIGR